MKKLILLLVIGLTGCQSNLSDHWEKEPMEKLKQELNSDFNYTCASSSNYYVLRCKINLNDQLYQAKCIYSYPPYCQVINYP